ncbi:MAG: hypothetical protein NC235_07625 [Clostridiales bacterium]|nr:hypothetical protein [Clostridiales bacterium]MCM1576974.1 hypothetical protein [Bacteroides sp.]
MGIRASYTDDMINRYFTQVSSIIKDEIMTTLSYLGEQSVARIRNRSGNDSWFDQTGNLRSSIGYAVVDHGRKVIESAFAQVKNGIEGSNEGKKLIDELISEYSNTYALIVVAGMNYADNVEAMENKDVLASTELWAKQQIDSYLQKTKHRINKRIQNLSI